MRCSGIIVALLLAFPAIGSAHHVSHVSNSVGALGNGTAQADGTLSSWVRLDLESAAFERELSSGSWRTLNIAGAWAPLDWLAITMNLPIGWLTYEDSVGHSTIDLLQSGSVGAQHRKGLSDMEVGALIRALRTEDGSLTLLAGLSAELPTGSPDERLGTGHVELIPSVELITQLAEQVSLSTQVRYTVSLDGHGHSHGADTAEEAPAPDNHGSLLTPHGEQEFITRMELDWFQDFGYLGAGAELVYGVHGPEGIQGIRAHGVVGVSLNEHILFTGGITLPVNDVVREEWKMHMGLTFRLGVEHEEPDGCGCPEPLPASALPPGCPCGPDKAAPAPPSAPGCCPDGECNCGPGTKGPEPEGCDSCPGCNG